MTAVAIPLIMTRIPNPEKGVPRFEVWFYGTHDRYQYHESFKRQVSAARALAVFTDNRTLAYIFDRRQGKAVTTNFREIKRDTRHRR